MTEIRVSLAPNVGDTFSPAAIEGLIGQTPMVVADGGASARATVTAARVTDDGGLELTMEVPEAVQSVVREHVREALTVASGMLLVAARPYDRSGFSAKGDAFAEASRIVRSYRDEHYAEPTQVVAVPAPTHGDVPAGPISVARDALEQAVMAAASSPRCAWCGRYCPAGMPAFTWYVPAGTRNLVPRWTEPQRLCPTDAEAAYNWRRLHDGLFAEVDL